MKLLTVLATVSFLVSCSGIKKSSTHGSSTQAKDPVVAFTVTDGILHPESALYSPAHKIIFVSNVASGNPTETKRVGYISQISPDGKVIKAKWITGLKAPKGLAIKGDFLLVTDVNEVVRIDIKTSKIVKTIPVRGSKFLNDLAVDKQGNVYVSDMFTDVIHIWNTKGVKPWVKTNALRGPNGLFTDGKEHLLFVSWGNPIDEKTFQAKTPGALSSISLSKPKEAFVEEKSFSGNLDGIDVDVAGNLWVSDWMNGDVYVVKKNGAGEKRFNFGSGTADISVAKELGLLLIPQMNQNKLIAVKIP